MYGCVCDTCNMTRSTRFQLYTVPKTRVYFAQYQIKCCATPYIYFATFVRIMYHIVGVTLLVRSGNPIEYFRVESNAYWCNRGGPYQIDHKLQFN